MIRKIFWIIITGIYGFAGAITALGAIKTENIGMGIVAFLLYMGYSATFDKVIDAD